MITSMTGFGRYEAEKDGIKITVEIKSVNHRYLDISMHIPRRFNRFDSDVRKTLQKYMSRGKIDVGISFRDDALEASGLKYNKELAGKYMEYFSEMAEEFGIENDITVSKLGRLPEIFTMEDTEDDEDMLRALITEAVGKAAEAFRETRMREGEALKRDLLGKLDNMLTNVDEIEKRYPEIIEEYRQKLLEKLAEVKADTAIDDSRLAAELVIYSDRLCTDEETVRLRNHILTMKKVLEEGGEAGRRLDFMAQEMNREANTILSKANDLRTSQIGIAMKTDIEKIREQIQNIE